ncbi:MAG: 16S rRNA (guanine(527)-N(7))-methyltransferase RsmG [Thermotogota bacterium]|nr:16S rRNA (guanine(527)-N(7))-methyltransferase RsmG [Thermotogota bacterium]
MGLKDFSPEKKLHHFLELLLESPYNLTSIKETERAYIKHVEDVIRPFKEKRLKGSFIDVGTGGGVPGLVMAIIFPETRWLLVDSIKKKIIEVERFIHELELSNVHTMRSRVEELSNKYRKYFDGAFSRALGKTDLALELCAPFVKKGGSCYIYKGPSWVKEKPRIEKACSILGFSEPEVVNYRLTDKSLRTLLVFEKIKGTPEIFPRRVGKALKKPIGIYPKKV